MRSGPKPLGVGELFLVYVIGPLYFGAALLAALTFVAATPVIVRDVIAGRVVDLSWMRRWLLAGTAPSVLVAGWLVARFMKASDDRFSWELSEGTLRGGRDGRRSFELASVVKVVPGGPPVRRVTRWGAKLAGSSGRAADCMRRASLVLFFEDGKLLLLNLYAAENGAEIMAELARALAHKVDANHRYSESEARCLRRGPANQLRACSRRSVG